MAQLRLEQPKYEFYFLHSTLHPVVLLHPSLRHQFTSVYTVLEHQLPSLPCAHILISGLLASTRACARVRCPNSAIRLYFIPIHTRFLFSLFPIPHDAPTHDTQVPGGQGLRQSLQGLVATDVLSGQSCRDMHAYIVF